MLRVLRTKTLNINPAANLNENSCGTLPTFFFTYLLTFKTVSTEGSSDALIIHDTNKNSVKSTINCPLAPNSGGTRK